MFKPFKSFIQKTQEYIHSLIKLPTIFTYYKETGKGLTKTFTDKGNYGEYASYQKLAKLPGYHKVVFNIYIPKGNNQTTEIDVVFIHETGIYVIESKNYSGWIFGHEKDLQWTQTFQNGKKYPFYNPIKQNSTHIRALKTLLPSIQDELYKSIIVFSERCTLKKVQFDPNNAFVLNRYDLQQEMLHQVKMASAVLDKDYIDKIYQFLSTYAKKDAAFQQQHVKQLSK